METIARVNKLLITWARLNTVVLHFILPTGKFLLYSIEPWLIYHAVLWVVRLFMLCLGSFVVFESVIRSVLNVVDSGWPWWAGRSPWCRRLVWYLCCHLFVYIYAAIYLWYWQLLMYWFIYCFIIFYSHVDMWYLYCHLFVYIYCHSFMIWTIINVLVFLLFLL